MTIHKQWFGGLAGLLVFAIAAIDKVSHAMDRLPSMAQVDPIIILFIDNSPSMAAISTLTNYRADIAYDDWGFSSINSALPLGNVDGPFVDIRNISSGNCPDGFTQGVLQSVTRCLRLPSTDHGGWLYENNYLNFLFAHFDSDADLTGGANSGVPVIPTTSRFANMKQAARELVTRTPQFRHCLTSMDANGNLQITSPCGGNNSVLLDAIDALEIQPNSASPLASRYHDVVSWLRGTYSPLTGHVPSPLNHRCQGIGHVVFTDGYSVGDHPDGYSELDEGAGGLPPDFHDLPDWDGLAPFTAQADFDNRSLPEHADGFGGDAGHAGSYLYLDDLAAWGASIDLRPEDHRDASGYSYGTPWGLEQEDPFSHQRLLGFMVSPRGFGPVLDEAARAGGGRHVAGEQVQHLADALPGALPRPRIQRSSQLGPVTHLAAGNTPLLYAVTYDTDSWTGSIAALPLDPANPNAVFSREDALWLAEDGIPPHDQRRLFSVRWPVDADEVSGQSITRPLPIELRWSELSLSQQNMLQQDGSLIDWVAGDPASEINHGGRWRDRESLLGAIVHSKPVLLTREGAGNYPDNDHRLYREQRLLNDQQPMLFAAANNGLLHAFTAGEYGGEELFAYLPTGLFDRLESVAEVPLVHQWMLDGPLTLEDARIGDQQHGNPWRSILVGSLGRGGAGVFALDVSNVGNPAQPPHAEELVLWEIGPDFPRAGLTNAPLFPDLGRLNYPLSMVRTRTDSGQEHWLAVIPNGSDSAGGKTLLYLVNLSDGSPFQDVQLANDDNGGLVTADAVDTDGDSYIDRIYAGDLSGRIWRLDWDAITGEFVTAYGSPGSPEPFLQLDQGKIASQGISFSKIPGRSPVDGLVLHFGTETPVQNDIPGRNTLFGVWDAGDAVVDYSSQLMPRTLTELQVGEADIRLIDGDEFQLERGGFRGWRIDLPTPGEQVIGPPVLQKNSVLFMSRAAPDGSVTDPCMAAPETWFTTVDSQSGLATGLLTADINQDGVVDAGDSVAEGRVPAAVGSQDGAENEPRFIRLNGDDGRQILVRIDASLSGRVTAREMPTELHRFGWRRLYQP